MPVKVTWIATHSLTQSNLWQACHPVPVICGGRYLSNRWKTNTCEQKTRHSGRHSDTFTQSFLELEVTPGWKNSFQKSLHHTVPSLPPSSSFCSISPPTFPPDSWMRHTQEYQELPHKSRGTRPPCLLFCVGANEFITRAAHTARSWNVQRVDSTASSEPWQKSSEIKVQLQRWRVSSTTWSDLWCLMQPNSCHPRSTWTTWRQRSFPDGYFKPNKHN